MSGQPNNVVKGCWTKIAYHDQKSALLCATEHPNPMRAYRCPVCTRYHLTRKRAA